MLALMPDIEIVANSEQLSLIDMPSNVMRLACQLLIDDLGDCGSWHFLRDILSLRLTCVYIRDVINNLVLFFPCNLNHRWLLSSSDKNVSNFLNFMISETNWRFHSFNYRLNMWVKFDNLPLLYQYGELFSRSIGKVALVVSEENYSLINDLMQWLEAVALKIGASFEISFVDSILPLSYPSAVTKVYRAGFASPLYVTETLIQKFCRFTNLMQLHLPFEKFRIELLKQLPYLTSLHVLHLDFSNVQNLKTLPSITTLAVASQEVSNFNLLPGVIYECFLGLKFFHLGLERGSRAYADFSHFSDSCYLLSIPTHLLTSFAGCCHLKYLSLSHDNDFDYYSCFQHGSQLQVSILKISFSANLDDQLSSLFDVICNFISKWKCLQIFSIKLDRLLNYGMYISHSLPMEDQSFNKDADKFFAGEQNFECDQFIRQLDEMRKLWIASNIQLLIFGKTVWTKRTASSYLITHLDQIDALQPVELWEGRPRNAVVALLEDS